MDVSIIIVNFNTCDLTINCLKSIYKYTHGINFEVIVVDNNSFDNSQIAIKEFFPNIHLILNEKNLGFGSANNIGAKVATGKYLFFLNSDTLLLNNTIYTLFSFMELKPEGFKIGACGVSLLNKENGLTVSAGNFPSITQEIFELGIKYLFMNYFNKKLSLAYSVKSNKPFIVVDYICGADVFIEKSIFDLMHGFDEIFFMYYEETDLFFQLRKAGYKSVILPNENLIHLEGGSFLKRNDLNLRKYEMSFKSKSIYYRKNKGIFALLIMKLISILFVFSRPSLLKHWNKILPIIYRS